MSEYVPLQRRAVLKTSAAAAFLTAVPIGWARAGTTITMADIGVGDPGSWERFSEKTGHQVELTSIGNAPSAVVNQLLAAGGLQQLHLVNIVGGMQEPMVQNDLIRQIDTSMIPNWSKNEFIQEHLSEDSPGFQFIGLDGQVYGVPTVLQGDSFAYLPDETGELASYGALFDPKFRGFVALEDNYTTAGQKTALFLNKSGQAKIGDPADMTPEEIRTVVDFLIENKKAGQFRVIWSSFEQAVNLLTSKEVHVMDCWEPMVFAANDEGANAAYADPEEGYLLWAMAAYIVNNPNMGEEDVAAAYDLLNFMLDGWYGATITLARGYMTNPQAVSFAKESDAFTQQEAARVAEITEGVKKKFQKGGTWQNRWPTNVDVYEEEWQRFKSA